MLDYGYGRTIMGSFNAKKQGTVSRETCSRCGQFSVVVVSYHGYPVTKTCGNNHCSTGTVLGKSRTGGKIGHEYFKNFIQSTANQSENTGHE
jgi:hypothetical protein